MKTLAAKPVVLVAAVGNALTALTGCSATMVHAPAPTALKPAQEQTVSKLPAKEKGNPGAVGGIDISNTSVKADVPLERIPNNTISMFDQLGDFIARGMTPKRPKAHDGPGWSLLEDNEPHPIRDGK